MATPAITLLVPIYAPVISAVLDLERDLTATPGGVAAVAETAQAAQDRLVALLRRAEQRAVAEGGREADVREASFAVVAWIDETLARYPGWSRGLTPLQVLLYKTSNAGNEFFDHLKALDAAQDPVREVYYLVLCLGFVGEYYFDDGGETLARIKAQLSRHLTRPPVVLGIGGEPYLTPVPYGLADPPPLKPPFPWRLVALLAAILLLVLLPLALILWLLLRAPDPAVVRGDIERAIAGFECANLAVAVDAQRKAIVTGHVASDDDRKRLAEVVARVPGHTSTAIEARVRIWPFCEIIDVVRNHLVPAGSSAGVRPSGHGLVYRNDEPLVVEAEAPPFPGVIYVTYVQRDGHVVHMLPNAETPGHAMAAGQRVVLGEPVVGRRHYRIAPPFGEEMVLMLYAERPLFARPRPDDEPARDFLDAIIVALDSGNRIQARYFFIETRP